MIGAAPPKGAAAFGVTFASTLAVIFTTTLTVTSCRESPPPVKQPAAAVSAVPRPQAPAGPHSPRSQEELPTTDGALAVSSFLGIYDLACKSDADHPKDPPPTQLVSLLSSHAQYFGTLKDYDRALSAAERSVRAAPQIPEAYLQRASARQALHEFDGALADLDQALLLKADPSAVDAARAGILSALGRYDEALAIRKRLVAKRATFFSLAALAQLTGEMGQTKDAEILFSAAQDKFDDVSPFPLSWLYFQEGLLAERAGLLPSARALYEEAYARLPIYAPVVGHLAAIIAMRGDTARALELLEPIVGSADDPEYGAQLGALLVKSGDVARGTKLIAAAKLRYDELVRLHPAAFADHAANFWLGAGADPKRALALARKNLAFRKTRDAYLLVMDAAHAAHDDTAACAAATDALKLPYPTAILHLRSGQAYARCGMTALAEAELALALATK